MGRNRHGNACRVTGSRPRTCPHTIVRDRFRPHRWGKTLRHDAAGADPARRHRQNRDRAGVSSRRNDCHCKERFGGHCQRLCPTHAALVHVQKMFGAAETMVGSSECLAVGVVVGTDGGRRGVHDPSREGTGSERQPAACQNGSAKRGGEVPIQCCRLPVRPFRERLLYAFGTGGPALLLRMHVGRNAGLNLQL